MNKKYHVDVDRVSTRGTLLEVFAVSPEEAKDKALEMAHNVDFSECDEQEAEYKIHEPEEHAPAAFIGKLREDQLKFQWEVYDSEPSLSEDEEEFETVSKS